jgi:hypothetical protein
VTTSQFSPAFQRQQHTWRTSQENKRSTKYHEISLTRVLRVDSCGFADRSFSPSRFLGS